MVWASIKHWRITLKKQWKFPWFFNEEVGGVEISFKAEKKMVFKKAKVDFMNFEKVIQDILWPEIVTLVTLGGVGQQSDINWH